MTAKEGSCVTFNLTLSNIWRRGYIVWLKDAMWNDTAMDYDGMIVYSLKPDKPNASEFENRVSVGSTWDLTIYELTISNLTLEDSGNYSVSFYDIFNPHYPMISSTMSLDVQDSPKDTKAKVVYYDIIKEGQAVTFSCHSKGNPQPTLSWFKLGQGEIAKGGEWKLPNVKIEDAGSYFCQAKNKLGTENSTNVILDVTYAPKEVRITASRTLEGIYEGAAVSLTCEVQSSNPSVRSYSWYRDHTDLGETGPVLRFPAVRPEDRGSYRCQASNSAGSGDSPEVTITVHYGPRGTKIKASCCEKGVKAGESLTLTCETDARPEPYGYTWFRVITEPGGQRGPGRTEVPVPSNGRSDGRDLRFWQISASDAGEYTCQAKNIVSAEKSTALRVDVLYAPKEVRITASRTLEGIYEGAAVSLTCEVQSSNPSERSYSWYRDRTVLGETGPVLRFPAVRPEDRGSYRCQGSNSVGLGDSPEVTITVHCEFAAAAHVMLCGLCI
ncbi:B-cell receptor CD22-like [Anguilla rostrata]|uniref:B-cell receptor CD22-like n=1 Tax=Anguilla rostrata TaxID=7938 RepID=UPI0030CEFFF6